MGGLASAGLAESGSLSIFFIDNDDSTTMHSSIQVYQPQAHDMLNRERGRELDDIFLPILFDRPTLAIDAQ
jgi:hypothetical protein